MLVLTDRMFEKTGFWAQSEAAESFGYDAVYLSEAPTEDMKKALSDKGLCLYTLPEEVLDPEDCEDIAGALRAARAIRLHDFGRAAGQRQGRRIGHGALDWGAVFEEIRRTGWQGDLIVDASARGNPAMEDGRALAALSKQDVEALLDPRPPMANWHVVSPEAEGLHTVIDSSRSPALVSNILRLNLSAGKEFVLETGSREMNAVLIDGSAAAKCDAFCEAMEKLDSFYLPGGWQVTLKAEADCVFYIAAADCAGIGRPFFRKLDLSLPFGAIHQIHGSGSGAREVFFTLNPEEPASHLLCGLTWSGDGAWTSWPPHQHEKDLEEVYCYFDMPEPRLGFHGSFLASGGLGREGVLHPVRSGHMVLAPRGYHPTVATPGTRNAYFWVLTAFSPAQRRYDLAVNDPYFK